MPGNSHCFEVVHVCVRCFVYLHVAQCVYRASAWEDKRRSTMRPRHQSKLIKDLKYEIFHSAAQTEVRRQLTLFS